MKLIVLEEDSNRLLHIFSIKNGSVRPSNTDFEISNKALLPVCQILGNYSDSLPTSCKDNTPEEDITKWTDTTSRCSSRKIKIDRIYFNVLIREITFSSYYRKNILRNFSNISRLKPSPQFKDVIIFVESNYPPPIDYSWGRKSTYLVYERMHLDSLMSWLSTLGGAFSALGDYDVAFADKAEVTSYKQMIIACRLGDMDLISRCWLYCALSLIQKKKYKKAARIIKYVQEWAKAQPEETVDFRILRMCQGIWTKLKYEHSLNMRKNNQLTYSSRQL